MIKMSENEEEELFEEPTEEEVKIGYDTYPKTVEEWVRVRRIWIWQTRQLLQLLKQITEKL